MVKKASRMGDNPLDAYTAPPEEETKAPTPTAKRSAAARTKPNPAAPKRKQHATFHMDPDIVQEMRDAVIFLAAHRITLADIAETGIGSELARLREKYNKGKPFPRANAALKGGRRMGY